MSLTIPNGAGFDQSLFAKRGIGFQPCYDFTETFEGSQVDADGIAGYDNQGWRTQVSASVFRNYTIFPAPLAGTKSILCSGGTYISRAVRTGFYSPFISAYMLFSFVSGDTNTSFININNEISQTPFSLRTRNTTANTTNFRIEHGGTISSNGTFLAESGKIYQIWIDGTVSGNGLPGTANFYIASGKTATKPAIPDCVLTNGVGTGSYSSIRFGGTPACIFDNIVVDTRNYIGSVPVY